jgi:acetyl esterase/lipase
MRIELVLANHFVMAVALGACTAAGAWASEPETVTVWPRKPPGETKELPPEANTTKPEDSPVGGRPIIKLTNVSTPTLSIYRPAMELDTGAAVIICPGGGHHILAFDHEGTEVAEWLNTLGVTGIVLKYRVPFRNPDKRWEAAVQDAQRAISLTRDRASAWGIDPARIGILGFSAGGQTAGLATLLSSDRQYVTVDDVDQVSCRPDFAVLVYPAWLVEDDGSKLRAEAAITKDAPPMFLVHAYDDPITPLSSLLLAAELKKVGVSAELHMYATGGHGYGMRDTGEPVNSWPARCGEWLKRGGWLNRAGTAAE